MSRTYKLIASTNYANRIILCLARHSSFLLLTAIALSASLLLLAPFPASHNALAQNQMQLQSQGRQQQQPDIKASNIYQTKTISLGKNIKNLVILIPNEGHEDPIAAAKKDLRVMNQPYIPQNAIVNVGTTVAWFSGDVAHRHSITLVDNKTKSTAYDSGSFNYFNASKPFTFNNVGIFAYSGPSNDKMWPNYKMNGTVTVVNQPLATSFNSSSSGGGSAAAASATGAGAAGNNNNNFDTIATLMVPSKLLGTTLANLKSQGFTIDNQYPFRSLRGSGSQAGGDPQQVLLVLASSGKNLNQVTSALSHVSATLPYK